MVKYNEKLRYNKKILNNTNLYKDNIKNNKEIYKIHKKNVLVGGNFFSDLSFGWQLLIILICIIIINICIKLFFKLKINGVVFPIIFGFVGINIYTELNKHMKVLGISLVNSNNQNIGKINQIINLWQSIMYSIPKVVPHFPQISNPSFNYHPFKGLRNGIQALRFPGTLDGEQFRFSINFPSLEIPFVDPLAGICCVWDQLKKLIDLFMKALRPPQRIIQKIFGAIKKAVTQLKNVIMKIIKGITKVVGVTTYPVIGLLYVFKKFLDFISIFGSNSDLTNLKNKVSRIINKLNNFRTGDFIGGNNSNNIDVNNLTINEIYYNIHLLEYEELHASKMNNIVTKLSIYKLYKIQKTKQAGIIRFVNKYKSHKFNKFIKKRMKIFKNNIEGLPKTKQKKYSFMDTDTINKMETILEEHSKGTYNNYDLNEIKVDYEQILVDSKNVDKFSKAHINRNINNGEQFAQYGGGLFSKMKKAFSIVKKIRNAIADIPKKANILCYIVDLILSKVKIITDMIGSIQKLILGRLPGFIQKLKDLIVFVNNIIEWFFQTIVDKGIRIIEAAMDLVKQLGKSLPAGIGTAIFIPIQTIFKVILAFLKLPFLKFFTGIVDILTNIPAFFKPVSDTIKGLCRIVSGILKKILNIFLGPALAVYNAAKKAYDAMMAAISWVSSFGGTDNSGLQKLLYKNKHELSIMTQKRFDLSYNEDKMNKDYLVKLDKLIIEKIKKIGQIHELLLKYKKKKIAKKKTITKKNNYALITN